MRLTLRTLLAYRDGVLSPTDSEDLHRRVQQSEDAGNLLKRISAVTSRMQPASPMIVGKGLVGDPNSVAEYLDDVLAGDKVPEFERICLESDVQLAELAHCHFVLSSAMQTSVKVPSALRSLAIEVGSSARREEIKHELKSRRHTELGSGGPRILRADQAHPGHAQVADPQDVVVEEHEVQVPAPMVASGGGTIKQQGLNLEGSKLAHEVPEYLVGANRGNWRVPLAIGALIAILGVLVWQTLGPWDRVVALLKPTPPAPTVRPAPETKQIPTAGIGEKVDSPTVASDASALPDPVGPNGANKEPPPATAASIDGQSNPSQPTGANAAIPEAAVNSTSEPASIPPNDPSPSIEGQALWLPKDDLEKQAVLLTRSGQQLQRLVPGDAILPGAEVVVPPHMRTTIDMPGGVLWTTCGATIMTIANPQIADINIDLCRGLMRSGPSGKVLRVACPFGDYRIELLGASSRASLEVAYRALSHGSVVDRSVYRPVLVLIAAEGSVKFESVGNAAQRPIELGLGEGVAVMESGAQQRFKLQNIPTWYRSGAGRPIDYEAAKDLSKLLVAPAGGPATEASLEKLTSDRRPETAALAIQTAMLLGRWGAFSQGFLDDERMRSHWGGTIDLARQLLAADAEQAKVVRTMFVRTGAGGEAVFEMLCGLSEAQLATDGLTRLVDALEDDDLASRVVANYQLTSLTGKAMGYQPQAPNRASIQSWRRELVTNRLKAEPVQDWIWERVSR